MFARGFGGSWCLRGGMEGVGSCRGEGSWCLRGGLVPEIKGLRELLSYTITTVNLIML